MGSNRYSELCNLIVNKFSETEEYTRAIALNLNTVDICLDDSYPGYSDGILALRGVGLDNMYFRHDIYANISLLKNKKLLNSILYSRYVDYIHVVDYNYYDNYTTYYAATCHYDFSGDVPDNLELTYLSSSMTDCGGFLENLDEKNIKLELLETISSMSLNLDNCCNLLRTLRLFLNVCLDVYKLNSTQPISVSIEFSDENSDEKFKQFKAALFDVYSNDILPEYQRQLLNMGITFRFIMETKENKIKVYQLSDTNYTKLSLIYILREQAGKEGTWKRK